MSSLYEGGADKKGAAFFHAQALFRDCSHRRWAPECAREPPPKPVCTRFPLCLDCPYPGHGFLCWGEEADCLRTRMRKRNERMEKT